MLSLQHFGIFYEAVETADGNVNQPRQAVTEALANKIKLDETNQRAERNAPETGALARGQGGMSAARVV
jgi:hypothetical protein